MEDNTHETIPVAPALRILSGNYTLVVPKCDAMPFVEHVSSMKQHSITPEDYKDIMDYSCVTKFVNNDNHMRYGTEKAKKAIHKARKQKANKMASD